MKVLITDDCNMFEGRDPYATLVAFSTEVTKEGLKLLERNQLGATRTGGRLSELLEDVRRLGITPTEISTGRKSHYVEDDYSFEYRLISGNY